MANDFKRKEPSKTEKVLFDLMINQQQMEKGLWSTSTLVIALAMLTKQDPKDVAELMVNGDEKIKEFSKKVNDEIKAMEEKKRPASAKAASDEHAGHNHQ